MGVEVSCGRRLELGVRAAIVGGFRWGGGWSWRSRLDGEGAERWLELVEEAGEGLALELGCRVS